MINDKGNHDGHGHSCLDAQKARRLQVFPLPHSAKHIEGKKADQEIGLNRVVHHHARPILDQLDTGPQKGQSS